MDFRFHRLGKRIARIGMFAGILLVSACDNADDPCSPEPDPMTDACLAKRTEACAKLDPTTCTSVAYCFAKVGRRIVTTASGGCLEPWTPVYCQAKGDISYPLSGVAVSPSGENWYFGGRPFPPGWTEAPNINGEGPDCSP